VKYQVVGLFDPPRVADLRETFAEKMPGVKLIDVDYKTAVATVEYSPRAVFPGVKPDDVVKQFDQRLRGVSHGTFWVRPVPAVPEDKLQTVEIGVAGLDCRGCSFAAYAAAMRVEGVVRATASMKEGRVTAVIDPAKTDRAAVEAMLVKWRVTVKPR
jgi:hypothetical protein